jgi:ABC-type multidrug transport system ATPase subunit
LDSASSLNIIGILKALCQKGRTIISTIHQPSSEIFENFDKLLLLVKGKAIYQVS